MLANLESGRRKFVTLDEVIALAYVLDVAPIHLVVPISDTVYHSKFGQVLVDGYRLTETVAIDSHRRARAWIKGELAIPGVDQRRYDLERPDGGDGASREVTADEVLAYIQRIAPPKDGEA